jgi:hypothetical protein
MEWNKTNEGTAVSILLFFGALTFIIGFMIGFSNGRKSLMTESVKLNHAEWVADSSGLPKFKWKTAEQPAN